MQIVDSRQWLNHLIAGGAFIDVRAPVEFARGSLPGAKCLPILNDEERHLVGTCYKQKGPDAAVALGHSLVSGQVKINRVKHWQDFLQANPTALLFCFRGGQRSQISQTWLSESGSQITRIAGGFKAIRQTLLNTLEQVPQRISWLSISGHTGSGKTHLLHKVASWKASTVASLDLEFLAKHKGSAFGNEIDPQPSQIDFENLLAIDLLRLEQTSAKAVLVEDEARTIGKVALPETFFNSIRVCPLILIEESVESRARQILEDYVLDRLNGLLKIYAKQEAQLKLAETLRSSLARVERKLGTQRFREVMGMLETSLRRTLFNDQDWTPHLDWISYLLVHYYDPYYEAHMARQSARIQFRGSREQVIQYLSHIS